MNFKDFTLKWLNNPNDIHRNDFCTLVMAKLGFLKYSIDPNETFAHWFPDLNSKLIKTQTIFNQR